MSDTPEYTRLWNEWLATEDGKSYQAGWGDYATKWHAERGKVWVRDRVIERLAAERDWCVGRWKAALALGLYADSADTPEVAEAKADELIRKQRDDYASGNA